MSERGIEDFNKTINDYTSNMGGINSYINAYDKDFFDNWKNKTMQKAIQEAGIEQEASQKIQTAGEITATAGLGIEAIKKLRKLWKGKKKPEDDDEKEDDDDEKDEEGEEEEEEPNEPDVNEDIEQEPSETLEEPSIGADADFSDSITGQLQDTLSGIGESASTTATTASTEVPSTSIEDAFEDLPSGLGDLPQVETVSTVFSTQGGSYVPEGTASASQQLSGIPEQQAMLDLNRLREGQSATEMGEGIQEGQALDQLAPMREMMAKTQAGQEAGQTAGEEVGQEVGQEAGQTAGEAGEALAETTGKSVAETVSSGLSAGGEIGGEIGGEVAGEVAGTTAGEIAGATLGALSTGLEALGPVGVLAGIGIGLYELFKPQKKPTIELPPKAPKPPVLASTKGELALPSYDSVVDTPVSVASF